MAIRKRGGIWYIDYYAGGERHVEAVGRLADRSRRIPPPRYRTRTASTRAYSGRSETSPASRGVGRGSVSRPGFAPWMG